MIFPPESQSPAGSRLAGRIFAYKIEQAMAPSMLIGRAKFSSHLTFRTLTKMPQIPMKRADVRSVRIESRPSEIPIPRKAEIIPKNRAVMNRSPHFISRFCSLWIPPWIFFKNRGMIINGVIQPSVITHATAVKAAGSVMGSAMLWPNALRAVVAAGSSYVTAPRTLRRIQGRGRPKALVRPISPIKMDMDGKTAKTALEKIVFLMTEPVIPNAFPRRRAFMRKYKDWAITKVPTRPPKININ